MRAWPAVAIHTFVVSLVIGASVASAGHAAPRHGIGCERLRFTISDAGAPTGARATTLAALHRFSLTTGIPLEDVRDDGNASPHLVVEWTTHDHPDLSGRGVFAHASGTRGASGELVAGRILLDARAALPMGLASRRTWGAVLLHELGHVAGLTHSTNPSDIMYPGFADGPAEWSPTETHLLETIGARLGCRRSGSTGYAPGSEPPDPLDA